MAAHDARRPHRWDASGSLTYLLFSFIFFFIFPGGVGLRGVISRGAAAHSAADRFLLFIPFHLQLLSLSKSAAAST